MLKKLFLLLFGSNLIGSELKVSFPRINEINRIRFVLEQDKVLKARLKSESDEYFLKRNGIDHRVRFDPYSQQSKIDVKKTTLESHRLERNQIEWTDEFEKMAENHQEIRSFAAYSIAYIGSESLELYKYRPTLEEYRVIRN